MDNSVFPIFFLLFQVGCVVTGPEAYRKEGVITSPGYPANYPNNVNKEWLIKAVSSAARLSIVIDDQDIHKIQGLPCYDYLKIEEVDSKFMLYKQCGKGTIKRLTATGNKVKISFKSDELGSGKGFRLKWSVEAYKTTRVPLVRSTRMIMPLSKSRVVTTRKTSTGAIPSKRGETPMRVTGTSPPILTTRQDPTRKHSIGDIPSEVVKLRTAAFTTPYVSLSPPNTTKTTFKVTVASRITQPLPTIVDGLHRKENNFTKMSTSLELREMGSRNLATHSLSSVTAVQYISDPKNLTKLGSVTYTSLLTKDSKSNQRKLFEEYPLRDKLRLKLKTLGSLQTSNQYFPSTSFPFHLKENELSTLASIKKSSVAYRIDKTKKKLITSIYIHVTASQNAPSSYDLTQLTTEPVATKKSTTHWTGLQADVSTMKLQIKWPKTTENKLLTDITPTEPNVQDSTNLEMETLLPQSAPINAFLPVIICIVGFFILLSSFLVFVVYVQRRRITRLKKVSGPKYLDRSPRYSSILQVGCRSEEGLHLYDDMYRFRPVRIEQNENIYCSPTRNGNEWKLNTFSRRHHVSTRNCHPKELTPVKEKADYVEILPEINTVYLEPVSIRSKGPTPVYAQSAERRSCSTLNEVPPRNSQEYEMLNFSSLPSAHNAVHHLENDQFF